MTKYVYTFMEDKASANGKSTDPAELLEKMKLRGEIEPLEDVEAKIRKEYQGIIDNLTKKLDEIADQELTAEEIIWLNFIRERKVIETKGLHEQIDARDKIIEDVRADSQKRAEQLALFAEKLKELYAAQ